MGKVKDITGQTFGLLTVEGVTEDRAKDGSMVWLCRCSCGKTVYASTTYLKKGLTTGCKQCIGDPKDLTGNVYGKLRVLEPTQEREKRSTVWKCECSCGQIVYANTTRLKTGVVYGCKACAPSKLHKRKNLLGQHFGDLTVLKMHSCEVGKECVWICRCVCGKEVQRTTYQLEYDRNLCRNNHGDRRYNVELAGVQINRLTVVEKLNERNSHGSVMWRCVCSCGKECVYSSDVLRRRQRQSCGCYGKERNAWNDFQKGIHQVEGTCVEALQRKMRSDNTTGYTGVYRNKKTGKWVASITFKGVRYHLGTFANMTDAVRARQRGEEMHDSFLDAYYREHPEVAARRRRVKKSEWVEIKRN